MNVLPYRIDLGSLPFYVELLKLFHKLKEKGVSVYKLVGYNCVLIDKLNALYKFAEILPILHWQNLIQ